MMEAIKAHLKGLLASAGAAIAIVAALFTIDARYAHADDVKKEQVQIQLVVQQTTTNLRKQLLEDKVFELDMKKSQQKLNGVEEALRERYTRQLKEISR